MKLSKSARAYSGENAYDMYGSCHVTGWIASCCKGLPAGVNVVPMGGIEPPLTHVPTFRHDTLSYCYRLVPACIGLIAALLRLDGFHGLVKLPELHSGGRKIYVKFYFKFHSSLHSEI